MKLEKQTPYYTGPWLPEVGRYWCLRPKCASRDGRQQAYKTALVVRTDRSRDGLVYKIQKKVHIEARSQFPAYISRWIAVHLLKQWRPGCVDTLESEKPWFGTRDVECFPSRHEVLESVPSTTTEKEKEEIGKKASICEIPISGQKNYRTVTWVQEH